MRLIDTDALEGGKFRGVESWTPIEASSWQRGWNDAIDAIISNVSTVDAPEVVRCKDCRWYENDGWGCGNCYRRNVDYLRMSGNGFCSYGERREDDKG